MVGKVENSRGFFAAGGGQTNELLQLKGAESNTTHPFIDI